MLWAAKFIVFPLIFCVIQVWSAPADEKYSDIDFESILANRRVLSSYVKCLTDKGPCTPQGKELKKIVPEVIQTSCTKCSPQQKKVVRNVITTMQSKYKDQWDLVVNKYDPKKQRAGELKAFLAGTD
ncbi:hypothetical protein LSTR_LSTR000616 [Laodelphax striatellus]|uniref:Uncharacterized protein n=1 Tax=Laodelphax striatellus TaxID=195883 RepID=A0A482XG20_LAOST|nr:hypothetical protein LSTR_LSTR000616 [Laodelphax striatellus]